MDPSLLYSLAQHSDQVNHETIANSFHLLILFHLHIYKYNNKQWDLEIKSRMQEEGLKEDRVANNGPF